MTYQQLSRTLPKDFTFYSPNEPRTPDRPSRELLIPARPGHASHRVRRRRIERKPIPFSAPDIPLPSIELPQGPEAQAIKEWCSLAGSTSTGYLEVPRRQRVNPITPPAQIRETNFESSSNWGEGVSTPLGASISRPSSACSNASDSSDSSCSSSRPSFGGSCTSPESEIQDPFLSIPLPDNKQNLETPTKASKSHNLPPLSQYTHRWSSEMDNHLWNTYQTFLQDPTITPFKMLPGSLPPLGVSYRVARDARKTWLRTKQISVDEVGLRKGSYRGKHASTGIPNLGASSSIEETEISGAKQLWPRSDAATRRRLKELCKRKYSIAPHYQRLLMSRSPSPPPELLNHFTSTTSARPETSCDNVAPFSRDLEISLVSGTVPNSLPETGAETHIAVNNANEWATSTTQPAAPVSGDNSGTDNSSKNTLLGTSNPVRRLGSPFTYHTWGPSRSRRRARSVTPVAPHDTVHFTGSRLRSAIPPDMFSSPHKRRVVDDSASSSLESPAGGRNGPHQRGVRVRNRGATIGTLNSREQLTQLFSPPSLAGSNDSENQPPPRNSGIADLAAADGIKRLGSPFDLDHSKVKRSQQHFRHMPSRSDPFIMAGAHKWMSPTYPAPEPQFDGGITPNPTSGAVLPDVERTPQSDPVKQ